MDKEKHNCDNVSCNHNNTKGLCCLFNPDDCKYRQLQKENTNLKDVIEGYKKIAKWCDKCDKIAELEERNTNLRQSFENEREYTRQLQKEIGKLKQENAEMKAEWQEQVQKATDEGYARTLQTMQLSKAKELLKKWVELYKPKLEGYPITPIQEQTEQFLNEVEK